MLSPDQLQTIEELLNAHEAGADVTIWEDDFLSDLAERYEKWGAELRL